MDGWRTWEKPLQGHRPDAIEGGFMLISTEVGQCLYTLYILVIDQ